MSLQLTYHKIDRKLSKMMMALSLVPVRQWLLYFAGIIEIVCHHMVIMLYINCTLDIYLKFISCMQLNMNIVRL